MFEGFKKIELTNREEIQRYINQSQINEFPKMSDWFIFEVSFSDDEIIYLYKVDSNYLNIIGFNFKKNEFYIYPPFGEYKSITFKKNIIELFEKIKKNTLEFIFVPIFMIKIFLELKSDYNIEISFKKSESDYIYSLDNFKKYIRKTKLKNFTKNHNISYEIISEKNKKKCLEIQKKYWCDTQKCNGKCKYCSKISLKNIVDNYSFFEFKGILIKKDKDDYIGFSINSKHEDCLIFFELKAEHISGLNYYIFDKVTNLFCKDVSFINFTSDFGYENLKNYKRHLCKNYKLLNKYHVKLSKK